MAVVEGDKHEIERQLERAVCARVQQFKDQADSLTLESVRRLLEKDLGLEEFSLDVHKRFIRGYMEKAMESADGSNSEASTENVEKNVRLSKEAKMLPKKDPKKSSTVDEEIMEDSPIMGVLNSKSEVMNKESSISESSIEKAIWERADHFHANSTNITLAGVRRLLEEDLGLEKNSLDPFKKFISQQIDQVFASPKEDKHVKDVKKKAPVKDVKKKAPVNLKAKKPKKVSSEERSNSLHDESDEMEVEVNSRKVVASKRNIKNMDQPKKRKISEVKQKKPAKRQKVEDNDSDEDRSPSEEKSQSSVEKPAQKKQTVASGHGKRAENLKSVIKACGMSVAPSIYKKAKQVPEEKREAFIVKELEDILLREGLSKNPTEKEIKDCKKRKDTSRELEGIDMSNIICSRRRTTYSFASPVTPGVRAKKDKVDAKDSKSEDKDKNYEDDDDDDDECKKEKDGKEEDSNEEDEEEKKDGEEEEVEEDEEEEDEEEDDDDDSEDFDGDDNDESD